MFQKVIQLILVAFTISLPIQNVFSLGSSSPIEVPAEKPSHIEFFTQVNVPLNKYVTSNSILLKNLTEPLNVSLSGNGTLILNDVDQGKKAILNNNDRLKIKIFTGEENSKKIINTLSVNNYQTQFIIFTQNQNTPSLQFFDQKNISQKSIIISNKIKSPQDGTFTINNYNDNTRLLVNNKFRALPVEVKKEDTLQLYIDTLKIKKGKHVLKINLAETLSTFSFEISSKENTVKFVRAIQTGNLSDSIKLSWSSKKSSHLQTIYYGQTDHGSNLEMYPLTQKITKRTKFLGITSNFVDLKKLKPNTSYYFVIKEDKNSGTRYWFKTTPLNFSNERPLSVIMGSDSRNNRTPRRNANLIVSKVRPDAIWFAGDYVDKGTPTEWKRWLHDWKYTITADRQIFPIIPARGNHELSNKVIEYFFDAPKDNYYYISYGNNYLRHYILNSEKSKLGDQKDWFTNEISSIPSKNSTWRTAMYHRPTIPHNSSKSGKKFQFQEWSQNFFKEKFRLVLEGDSHTMKTTWPLKPKTGSYKDENVKDNFTIDKEYGTVYTGEGSWGAPIRSNNRTYPWTRTSGKFNQIKWALISPEDIKLKTVLTNNAEEVESLTIDQQFKTPNNLDIWKLKDQSEDIIIKVIR